MVLNFRQTAGCTSLITHMYTWYAFSSNKHMFDHYIYYFSCFPSTNQTFNFSYTSSCHIVNFPTSYINISNSRMVTWMDLCIERVYLVHVWRLSSWGRGLSIVGSPSSRVGCYHFINVRITHPFFICVSQKPINFYDYGSSSTMELINSSHWLCTGWGTKSFRQINQCTYNVRCKQSELHLKINPTKNYSKWRSFNHPNESNKWMVYYEYVTWYLHRWFV